MRKTTLFYLIAFGLLVLTFFFSSSAYQELVRYAELTNSSNTVYGSYQTLAKKIILAAVVNPQLGEGSKYSNVDNLFHTDRQSVIEELELLRTTAKDSINIKIAQELDTSIRTELKWLLESNVPDSIINRTSRQHIATLYAIDSLISEGMARTHFLLDYSKNKLSESISNLLQWMVIFILLSGFIIVYTIIIEQRRTATKIVKNENRFMALIENYDAVITVVNEKLHPIYRTPAAEQLTGFSNRDKTRIELDDVHPNDAELLNHSIASVKANPGKAVTLDLRLRHKQGHYMWVEVTFTNLLHDPAVAGIVINKRDISDRKTAEEKIRESEISYRSLIEQASDAIFVSDLRGNYIDVNTSACNLLGYSRDELLSMSVKDILYLEEKIKLIPERLNTLKEGKSLITENLLKRKDGTPVEVEANSRMLPDGRIVGILRDITERMKVAAQLDKSEKRFRALIENSDDIIAMLDENMRPIYRSPSAERLTGYTAEDRVNGAKMDEIHPDDVKNIKNCLEEVKVSHGKPIHVTYRLKHKNGHYIWLEGTFTNLFEDSNVGSIVANMRDITLGKNAELRLSQTLKEVSDYKFALDESSIVAITDQKGIIKYANDNFCTISKYSREELIGQDHRIINSAYHPKEFIKNIWTTIANGKVWRNEIKNRAKDGTYYWVDTTIVPFLNEENKPYQYMAIRADITERKNAELKLSQTLKEVTDYKFALDESCIVAITDQKGIIKYANDNFCTISKYSREELIGQDHRIINSGYHPREFIKNIWTTIANGKVWRNEIKNRAKDGTYYWVDTTIIPFLNEENKPYQYMAIRADVTERKNAELKLSQSLKEVTDYKFALDESSIVAITDQKGIIKYVNDNFCAISKYSREELIGQDHRIINSAYHPKEFIKNIWTTIANGKVWRNEIKNRAKDGTYYWVDTTIIPFLNEENKPYQYMAIRADITERKNAELKLSQTLKEVTDYKFALDESCIVAITDQKGIIKYANDNFCAISKYSREELIGQDHRIINSGYHPKEFIKNIWTTIANGKVWRNEIKNRAKDGTYYWVDTTIIPFLNEENKPYQYMAIRADITERKKAEEGIIASEEKLRFILDNMTEGVQIIGSDWKYIYLNSTAIDHSHYTAGELIGHTVMEKYPGIENTELFKVLQQCMDEQVDQQTETRFVYPDASVAWFQLSIQAVREGVFILSVDVTERKMAEEKALASEARFRALIENMTDAVVLNDALSNVIYQSPSVTRILGYSMDERKGKPVVRLVHEDDRQKFTALNKKLNENPGHPYPFQYRFLHKKGHYVWLEGVVTNLLLDPSVKAVVANYRDISERKEAEEKLRSERTLLRTLIDNLPDYIYVKDKQSRHILNNRANVELIGKRTEAETLGKSTADIFGPELARPYHEDDQRVFKSGKPIIDREETTMSSSGEIKYLLTTKIPLKDSHHNITGLVGISRDITKQKQVELDLRNSNYFLESAQRVGKVGHWISDIGKSGNLTWSTETYRIFGMNKGAFDGKVDTFFSFIHPDDAAELNLASESAINNNHTFSIDHRIVLRDGTEKWVHEQGEPTYDENGNVIRLVGIVQDITERKQAENQIVELNAELEGRVKIRTEQLQAANKEMEAFTYSVSHDLRSPLRIIDGYAQILIEDYINKLDEEGKNTLGIIMTNAKKMGQLIDDLLNFSRIGRAEMRKGEVDMNRLVKEVIHELDLSGIVIPAQLKIEDLPPAECDANLMKNVWINLLSNAIKYSGAKSDPEIEVGFTTETGKTIYYVRDNGAGFDMQYYHKLFGVFQRLHSHHEFSGTGVGLAIVQRIISRHGGSVWAESKLNEGTTFFFSLD